jgi:hypothetical protein
MGWFDSRKKIKTRNLNRCIPFKHHIWQNGPEPVPAVVNLAMAAGL